VRDDESDAEGKVISNVRRCFLVDFFAPEVEAAAGGRALVDGIAVMGKGILAASAASVRVFSTPAILEISIS
jgi:hypothetical protein